MPPRLTLGENLQVQQNPQIRRDLLDLHERKEGAQTFHCFISFSLVRRILSHGSSCVDQFGRSRTSDRNVEPLWLIPPWDRYHNVNLGELECGTAVFVLCRRQRWCRPFHAHRRSHLSQLLWEYVPDSVVYSCSPRISLANTCVSTFSSLCMPHMHIPSLYAECQSPPLFERVPSEQQPMCPFCLPFHQSSAISPHQS